MKRILHILFLCVISFFVAAPVHAAVTEAQGWFEAAYAQWEPVSGAADYNVYIAPAGGEYTQIDKELVRKYPTYYRADAVGLKAGSYTMKIVPVDASKAEMTSAAMTTAALTVKAHDRAGFAHVGMPGGIGAYKNDGTLKDNAKVVYVWADNANSIAVDVETKSDGTTTTSTGLQNLLYLFQKGYATTPIAIRIIGTIKKENMDELLSSSEGLQIKGKSNYSEIPVTIEGIGNDAAISGFGMLIRYIKGLELRNFSVQLCMDDCISLDSGNSNIWIHNMDFFYGNTGGDADQAKGDGTVDMKNGSTHITMSYCHFIDCGKASLGGMKSENTGLWHTYHHNWFDHSDSRHPRIRTMFYHVYNNYYDGISKYGVGVTSGGSAFVESNYFRNCKNPMLISKQGTDAEGDGTFSGEPGGVIKAYDNIIVNPRQVLFYDGSQTDGKWDAVLASSRDENITAKCYSGGTGYNNEADAAARSQYIESTIHAAANVPEIVKGWYGAGRMGHGDIKWTFNNSVQDENYGVISEMKTMLQQYTSTLVGFADGTAISNGGATQTVDAGDGKGIDPDVNDAYIPSYAGGGVIIGGNVSATFTLDGSAISWSGTEYTHLVSPDATETEYTVVVTPAADATIQEVTGATGSNGTYTIAAPALGGTSTATFTIASADGAMTKTYTINIVKQASSDATATFAIDGGSISMSGTSYTHNVASDAAAASYTITVTPADKASVQNVEGATGSDGTYTIAAPELGSTSTATFTIVAEDGTTTKTYTINIVKAYSTDATATFAVDGVAVNMSGTTGTHSVSHDATETSYTITVTPADKASIQSVEGANGENGTYTIAAPELGSSSTATFTIVAEDGTTAKTYTINITKNLESEICHFLDETPSLSYVTVTGSYSNSKGSVIYDGIEYGWCVKMESATNITITPLTDTNVTLVFLESGSDFKLDGTSYTTDSEGKYTFAATGGQTYTLTKGDVMNLFLIIFETGSGITTPELSTDATATFTLDGNSIEMTDDEYTHNVAYNAAETEYTVMVTPAEKASVQSVSGATGENGTYTITAPAQGATVTATFTIVAEDGTTTKTYTINIVKAAAPSTGMTETEICHFLENKPSLSYVTVSGNYSNKYGSVTYDDVTYGICLKIESSTNITITPPSDCKVTLVFDGASKRFYLDSEKLTTGADAKYTFDATGGKTYTLTKGDSMNLFLIIFETEGGADEPATDEVYNELDSSATGEGSAAIITLKELATVYEFKETSTNETVDIPTSYADATINVKRGMTANMWNTFCVPFSVSKAQMEEAFGVGTQIASFTDVQGTSLIFSEAEAIEAGVPYLVKPMNSATTEEGVSFSGVSLTDTEAAAVTIGNYTFAGTYVKYAMQTDGSELGMNKSNALAKPADAPNNVMRGLRAFFRIGAGNAVGAKVLIGGELTSIDAIQGADAGFGKGVYNVNGIFVRPEWNGGKGLPRGLYIVNGCKIAK